MKIIEVKNLSKNFGNIKAVDNLSFDVYEKSIFSIIGRNGAGKTTTLRMLLNIYQPDNGEILYTINNNKYQSTDTEIYKYLSYLPEERGLYKKMTVWDTIVFFAELKQSYNAQTKKLIEHYLQKFDLIDRKTAKIQDLSKGNQQKIQFIATIISDPQILILDEPFSGLDPININLMKDIILEQKQNGKTIIYSTHLIDFAEKMSDEVLFIDKGKNILYGNVLDIKRNFAKSNIIINCDDNFYKLNLDNYVETHTSFGKSKSIKLKNNISPQEFLIYLIDNNITINGFTANDISLQDIFISLVNQNSGVVNEYQ